jgi:S-adenosylmethionine:tRNA ribosyltransferase-isomerase
MMQFPHDDCQAPTREVVMFEALAGQVHLCLIYAQALARRCLWHEFGDLHLIL